MNAHTSRPLKRDDLALRLDEMTKYGPACFDEGLVDVDITLQRSTVEVTGR